jgi:hypothetical protein
MLFNLIDVLAGKWFDWRVRRSIAKPIEPLMIKEVELANNGGMRVLAEHPAVMILADQAAALLEESNATNYVQFDLVPRPDRTDCKPIRVTVQWAHGMSPGTKNIFLETALRDIMATVELRTPVDDPINDFLVACAEICTIAKLALSGVDWRQVVGNGETDEGQAN